jgi:uncharacterized protein (TIGR03435 family)
MRAFSALFFLLLFAGSATSQAANEPSTFDVGDVHASPRSEWVKDLNHTLQGGFLIGDRYELHRATLLDLIRIAYGVDAERIYGGPNWIDYDRFEVIAKTKPGTRQANLNLMLQALLTDRFHLVLKSDTQPVPGYVLSRGKGDLKIKPAPDGSGPGYCESLLPSLGGVRGMNTTECRNMAMDAFAPYLRFAGLPVVNETGLDGGWDFTVQYPSQNVPASQAPDALIEALGKMGLRLEAGKVPQPVLNVQSADEQPSANPPGIAEALPPLPLPEFEVASLRLSGDEDHITTPLRVEPGGRVVAYGSPVAGLIRDAWRLPNSLDIAGIPKPFLQGREHNVHIEAKAPANFALNTQNQAQAREVLGLMLRSLLIDRFKMKVHDEDRPMDTDTLVAVKPKLTKADPATRTACTRKNQQQNGTTLVTLTCRNMTMTQFAEQIRAYDIDIYYPVIDGTGLNGAWDFEFTYDALAGLRARYPNIGAAQPQDGQPSDPVGGYPFAQALEKQLGLKLEVHKQPQSVFVIDHMEEWPTEN